MKIAPGVPFVASATGDRLVFEVADAEYEGGVHLEIDGAEGSSSELPRFFDDEEIRYIQAIESASRRGDYCRSRKAVKIALAALTPTDPRAVEIVSGCLRQPLLKVRGEYASYQISLSHAGRYAAAFVFHPGLILGVDIEVVKSRAVDELAEYVTRDEIARCVSLGMTSEQAFTLVWTAKEALMKAFRVGLGSEFRTAGVGSVAKNGDMFVSTFEHHHHLRALSWHKGDLIFTIVAPAATRNIERKGA